MRTSPENGHRRSDRDVAVYTAMDNVNHSSRMIRSRNAMVGTEQHADVSEAFAYDAPLALYRLTRLDNCSAGESVKTITVWESIEV